MEVVMTIRTADRVHRQAEVESVARRYADAWVKNDLEVIIDSYHDEVVFHYFGRSPLAGTHRGKAACLALLKQVRESGPTGSFLRFTTFS
jgi:ketosteroid isomerase-like protein